MNKLTIYIDFPETVGKLLLSEDLIDHILLSEDSYLQIKHPDDGMSSRLKLWLDIAQAIGLIVQYSFNRQSGGRA